jgi:hypothetical protein
MSISALPNQAFKSRDFNNASAPFLVPSKPQNKIASLPLFIGAAVIVGAIKFYKDTEDQKLAKEAEVALGKKFSSKLDKEITLKEPITLTSEDGRKIEIPATAIVYVGKTKKRTDDIPVVVLANDSLEYRVGLEPSKFFAFKISSNTQFVSAK